MLRPRITYLFVFAFAALNLFSQNYNNAWINHNLKYYKIKVANDSLYKLDSLMLAHANVPVLNPKYLRFFQKGVELYPYIFGEADGVLNATDY
ncbi:MAG TPA: hypothetical protein VF411_12040, partial [Bacteroidia bacterium]